MSLGASRLTNCSRGIRNAWHFYYALNLVIKVVCRCHTLHMKVIVRT
ncbi:TPA: DUF3265 domain-containing protein [Vibrio parahaemolyticus]|nr:DUF3265 domain-containing protein [Vibrio parahaemolyticus]